MRQSWKYGIGCIVLLLLSNVAFADEAQQLFDSLFGSRIKQVKATIDRADDLVLAKDILAAAQTVDRVDVLALMCDSVIELAQRQNEGLPTAVEASRLLAQKVEARRAQAHEKTVELLIRLSASSDAKIKQTAADELITLLLTLGDDAAKAGRYDDALSKYRQAMASAQRFKTESVESIKGRMEIAGHRSRTVKQIARLREKLLADANDSATAHEIIRLYVVDLDQPAEAIKLLSRANDEKLKKLVPLAAQSMASTSEADSAELGDWYVELTGSAASTSKEAMMRRASAYLARYLASGPSDSLSRTRAELKLKVIAAPLAALDAEQTRIELKRSGPETWISSEATYKASSGNGFHRQLPALLTGGKNLHDGHFAFHTAENTAGQYIVIDLGSPKVISRIWIENRRDDSDDRAKGMSVYLSLTADDMGKAVWTAEKVAKEWTIQIPNNMKAQFITIKQADKNSEPLHLAQVKLFGWEK